MPVIQLRHAKHAKIANSRKFLMALRCHPPIARPPWGKHGFPFNKATFSWDILRPTFGYERFRGDMQQAASLVERPRCCQRQNFATITPKAKARTFPKQSLFCGDQMFGVAKFGNVLHVSLGSGNSHSQTRIMGATTLEVGDAIMTLLPTKKLYCARALFGMLQRESSDKISQSPTPRAAFWAKISVSLPSNA